jgi:pimeloyl-ACP methyl ester carboxylesterase
MRKEIAMSFHRAYAPVNGIRLHCVAAGSGQPMLFLHGHPDFWYLWQDQLAHLQQTHRVIAPDLRGYNLSDKPADVGQYRLPILVEDIRELIDHIGQSPVVLVAHDWGAVIAWEFAARYPAYLDKLVVLSTPSIDVIRRALRDPEQRKQWYYMLMVISPQAEQILRAGDYALYTRTVFGPPTRVAPDYFTDTDRAAYRQAWAQPGVITGSVNYYRAARLLEYFTEADRQAFLDIWTQPDWNIGGERFFDSLRPIDVFGAPQPTPPDDLLDDALGAVISTPTLMLIGEHEEFALNNQPDWFAQRVPNGTLIQIPNAGHRVIHEHPRLVTEYVRDFACER